MKHRIWNSISAFLLVMVMSIQMLPSQVFAASDADVGAWESSSVQEETEPPADGEAPASEDSNDAEQPPTPEETEAPTDGENQESTAENGDALKPLDENEPSVHGLGANPAPSSEKHELIWVDPGSPAVSITGHTYDITPDNNALQTITLQLNFTLGGTDSVPAGSVAIRIPKHILEKRDGSGAILNVDLGVPKAPEQGETNFNYTEDGDSFVLTNFKDLMPADNMTCTVAYQFRPSDIQDGGAFSFHADFEVTNQDGDTILETSSEELSITVHTSAKLYSFSKYVIGKWEEWQSDWGTPPEHAEDYFYVAYYYSCPLNIRGNTQPYTIRFEENPQGDSELIGWWAPFKTNSHLYTGDMLKGKLINVKDHAFTPGTADELNAGAYDKVNEPTAMLDWSQIRYQAVLVKYPRTSLAGGTAAVTNSITAKLYGVDTGDETPLDTKIASVSYQYENTAHKYPGDLYNFKKGQNALKHNGALNMLQSGLPVEDTWYLNGDARAWGLTESGTKDYTMVLEDTGLSSTLKPIEDYTFTSFFPNALIEYTYSVDEIKGYVDSPATDYSKYRPIEIYIQAGSDVAADNWTHYGTARRTSSSNHEFTYAPAYGQDTLSGLGFNTRVPLPENTARFKAVYTGNSYKTYLTMYVTTELKPTENVKKTAQKYMDQGKSWMVYNFGTMQVVDDQDDTIFKNRSQRYVDLTALKPTSKFEKNAGRAENDLTNSRVTQTFTIQQYEYLSFQHLPFTLKDILENKIFIPQQSATFYDLLPRGAKVDTNSVAVATYGQGNASLAGTSDAVFTVEFEENWRGSGQTMMIVRVTGLKNGQPNAVYFPNSAHAVYSGYSLTYTVHYAWEDIACYGNQMLNSVAYHAGEGYSLADGRPDDSYFGYNSKTNHALFEDLDADNPNHKNEKRFMYAEKLVTLNPVTAHESGLLKKVMGSDESAGYGNNAQAAYGGRYTYRLRFVSQTGQSTSDVVFYDVLESAGENGGAWRGVLEHIDISHPLSKGIDVKIYYSTNPTGIDPKKPEHADLSDESLWTLTEPGDLSAVTALAFDLTSKAEGIPYIFASGEGVEIFIGMRAPAGNKTGAAYNTAYLKATTTPASGTPSTATEPSNTTAVRLPDPPPAPSTGNLNIRKEVTGKAGEKDREFSFRVKLLDETGEPLPGSYPYSGSKTGSLKNDDELKLKHGDEITIEGIPAGTQYFVMEADYSAEGYSTTPTEDIGIISEDQTATAAFTNTKDQTSPPGPGIVPPKKSGNLTISKTVGGNAGSTTKEFTFTVTLRDTNGNPLIGSYSYSGSKTGGITSSGTVTLKHGETITIEGLPAGTRYVVAESDYSADGYSMTSTGDIGIISEDQTATAAFANTRDQTSPPGPGIVPPKKSGNLTISKTVGGNAGNTTKEFTFTVTLQDANGNPLTGSYSYSGSKTGSITSGGTVTLKHGDLITLEKLPAGTRYTVTEEDYSAEGYRMSCNGDTGSIPRDKTAAAVFANTKDQTSPPGPGIVPPPKSGNLTISKMVLGSSTTKEFTFTVTLQDANGNPLAGSYPYGGSKTGSITNGGTVTLSHGESITIEDLPSGVRYLVAENDYSALGCETTKTDDAGVIAAGKETAARFINRFPDDVEIPDDEIPAGNTELPKTGDRGITHWVWLMLLSIAGLCLTLFSEHKRGARQGKAGGRE